MSDNIRIITENNIKIVEINGIKFSSKRKIDWTGVEQYLKQYIGESFTIDEIGDTVYRLGFS